MSFPAIYADFQNADSQGRLRLICVGTREDLSRQGITLRDGLALTLYDEDIEADGRVLKSDEEGIWVAVIDWDAIRKRATTGPATAYRKSPA